MPRQRLRLLTGLVSILLAVATPGIAYAQASLLDEGTFRVTIAGRDIGRENFSIRRVGAEPGGTINARGNVVIDTVGTVEELTSALQVAGGSLQPTAYNLKIQYDGHLEQIAGRITAGRFISKTVSSRGEELREYLASPTAVVIDPGVVHQYYFLARRVGPSAASVQIIIPREGRQLTAEVGVEGEVPLNIGNQRIDSMHLVISGPGYDTTHLWVDSRSRVLRLEIPTRNLIASRTTAPR